MRKIGFLFSIIAATFVSCNKEVAVYENAGRNSSFVATLPDDTKTSLDGLNVLWSEGDQVDVLFDKTTFTQSHATFTLDGAGGTKTGLFTGGVNLDGKDLFVVYPKAEYSYPYQTITIPHTVDFASTNTVIPMYGLGNVDAGVSFHHLCSVIHVPLYAEASSGFNVSSVSLEDEAGNKISGRFYFEHSSSGYGKSLAPNSSGNYNEVTVNCDGMAVSEDPENPTDFFFVVRGGINFKPTVRVNLTDGRQCAISKGSVMELPAGKKISFTKAKVEPIQDKKMKIDDGDWEDFDLNSIGSISEKIAFKSTVLNYSKDEISSILSKITVQSSAVSLDMSEAHMSSSDQFPTCVATAITSHLTSIKLPEGLKKLINSQFGINYASKITDVYLPSTLSSIDQGAVSLTGSGPIVSSFKFHVNNNYFVDVDGVVLNKAKTTLVCFPAANTVVDEYTVPSTVTTINSGAFYYASYLKKLTIPANVTSISKNAFLDNYILEEICFEGHTAPTLTASADWETTKPTRAPGYRVVTAKKLTIPLAEDEDSYNAAGWTAFTAIGYAYDYWMQPQASGATISNLDENNSYSFNFGE